MAPYNFDAPNADAILRLSDGAALHVHRIILSLASPVFQDIFNLPQPTERPSKLPIIDIPESSVILKPFLQYLYPRSPPKISNLPMWEALYTIADKYEVEVVVGLLRDVLVYQFMDTSPLRVYALASSCGFEEVAKIASKRTLTINIFKDLTREDAELMGGAACLRLCLLHFNRREAVRDLITISQEVQIRGLVSQNRDILLRQKFKFCECNRGDLVASICQFVAKKPWSSAEELSEQAGTSCTSCRRKIHDLFAPMLEGISKLPQTI